MQVVVKTPHIDVNIKGKKIPKNLITVLKENFKEDIKIIKNPDDELLDVFETTWYKRISRKMRPGKALKIYRENHGLTQEELGKKLVNIARQIISNMENGTRPISLKMAKNLAKIFNLPIDRFI